MRCPRGLDSRSSPCSLPETSASRMPGGNRAEMLIHRRLRPERGRASCLTSRRNARNGGRVERARRGLRRLEPRLTVKPPRDSPRRRARPGRHSLLMPLALAPEQLGRRPSWSPTTSCRGGEEELIVQVLHDVSTFHSWRDRKVALQERNMTPRQPLTMSPSRVLSPRVPDGTEPSLFGTIRSGSTVSAACCSLRAERKGR